MDTLFASFISEEVNLGFTKPRRAEIDKKHRKDYQSISVKGVHIKKTKRERDKKVLTKTGLVNFILLSSSIS